MLRFLLNTLLIAGFLMIVVVAGTYWYLLPGLPSIETLKDVRLQVPLRVYSADGKLLAEFGEKRRVPVTIAEVPQQLVQAFLAAEDDRFYEHPGVDWQAILRAAIHVAKTGEKTQGGSTITMQVARNFFLSREKTYLRKLNEILLALKIERELDKPAILELYLNKIYLGHRAYGVGAAAQVYYGAELQALALPQLAMIAGLPKAPSRVNPISNPARALERRNYVLSRMLEQGHITQEAYQAAAQAPVTAALHGLAVEVEAPYVAEMVRSHLYERFGEDAYTSGLKVLTTIDSRLQTAANGALRKALLAYDQRHGYRGPEHHFELEDEPQEPQMQALLQGFRPIAGLLPAIVVEVEGEKIITYVQGRGTSEVNLEQMRWARPYITYYQRGARPSSPADILAAGDVIRVRDIEMKIESADTAGDADGEAGKIQVLELAQLPRVEGALVSMSPEDGAILALVGGFEFSQSKFNRVTQARRQPGSNFKPFIYSAALEAGETTASFINDSPIVFDQPGLESIWRPENYSEKYRGPIRLREALAQSRNLVSVRLLMKIGIDYALDHIARFGFDVARLPHNFSMSLGSGELAPIEVLRGYTVFANGGYLIEPFFIKQVVSDAGEVVIATDSLKVCRECEPTEVDLADEPETIEELQALKEREAELRIAPRAIPADNAWLMTSMMGDVIRHGTGRKAKVLGRNDLAGKTGTTNEQKDAWFSGFNAKIATTVWVGFDRVAPLGRHETGAQAALPMWIDFMRVALEGMPESLPEQPPGIITVRIDPNTGQLTSAENPDAIFEVFRAANVPDAAYVGPVESAEESGIPEQLF